MDPFKDLDCRCDNMYSSDSHFLTQFDAEQEMTKEKDAAQILSLYRQLKLQQRLHDTPGLDPNLKQDLIYTNTRLIGDIGQKIVETNTNYPKTFQNLTNDLNTNTILTAIQLRNIHLQTNPLYNPEDPNIDPTLQP